MVQEGQEGRWCLLRVQMGARGRSIRLCFDGTVVAGRSCR
jgi:hypothetical protein